MALMFRAFATNNLCFKSARQMPGNKPQGIVVHSTGANNPTLKRYVNCPEVCGENIYRNYYDRPDWEACPHAVIGKDKNGNVSVAQLLPFNICCWGCGAGKNGSYNYSPAYIQIEICEDGLTDRAYFQEAFSVAVEFCRQLIKLYNIPVKNVVSHKEAHALGYASNHGDPENWLSRFNKDMDWFRVMLSDPQQYIVTGTKTVSANNLNATVGQLKALGFTVETERN